MAQSRILSVGQCAADHFSISRCLKHTLDAKVDAAGTQDQAIEALRAADYDLILVNRIGDRDGRPGLDLIRALKADPRWADLPVMLVSNYPDAQADAMALGALPGFGKDAMGDPQTMERLRSALIHPA